MLHPFHPRDYRGGPTGLIRETRICWNYFPLARVSVRRVLFFDLGDLR
jgi:hypothetical protein